jgi:DsbC/DsbD-like thiol-disulfide interchange protein
LRICCSLALLLLLARATAQGPHYVSPEQAPFITARRGGEVEIPLRFTIRPGHHINSNAPAEDYLIPTALTWTPGPLVLKGVSYPKPESVKYEFSSKPLLVWSGTISLASKFAVPSGAPPGTIKLSGKLRYQACNDKACFPPKTLELSVPVAIQ